ncbi:hypothetical protein AUEXF2481DRAFT_63866 [Aureobasidium subglaciale EXF-2481]|uniref:HRQ family protein n=1 Tax=Aureobasidium subglaciale (strain EXF-2481) TaxID=1043005 RepID=A0A074ZEN9_AURSE|nr:uncharacterized protein AUEXF2481DRAFT_63866 [Aureobasidium subglaciale EXF-2481]KEQ97101.1 hypothetical protein AUEXF2481DRAFT_63866 [Aureobasidium subglaciale EXF-2481]
MAGLYLSILGVVFAIVTILYFNSNERQRTVLSSRFGLDRQRKLSWAPPRSPSPAKRELAEKTSLPSGQEYRDTFPPSRRSALAELTDGRFSVGGKSGKGLSELPHNTERCLPYDCNVLAPKYKKYSTPTGFTIEEIKALGNFPDYATLSGVPRPAPYTDFDIKTAKARPYRPIRWAYHQTMSYKKLEPDWWLELDSTYSTRIQQRQSLYATHGSEILQSLPGSEIACKELMEMCLQFLCSRYPTHFTIDSKALLFHNNILNTITNLREMDPLEVLLNNVPEDFAIVLRNPETGYYNFRAGVICSSLGWSVASKIGKDLKDIHAPIPDYKEKMEFSMDSRFFAKMPTDKPIQRGSWGLEVGEPLFMPPNDPHAALRNTQNPDHTISDMNLRVDWQTLRRLPLSGGVVFNFKCLFTPVTEFEHEAYIPGLMLKVLKEGKKELMEYKGTWHTEHVVIPALQEMDSRQKEKGMVEKDWEPVTLDEYPYFPGWQDKWHAQQGF